MTTALITASELKNLLDEPTTKVLDASWNLPPSNLGIPGARDFNIDDVADPIAPYAHTVPTEEIFAEKVRTLGISNNDLVVVYDRNGISMAAARAWWMFRLFGHNNVKVLDGGLNAWTMTGYITSEKPTDIPAPGMFSARFNPALLKLVLQMNDNISGKEFSVIDARDAQRFALGHIPNSASIPYASLIDTLGTLKPRHDLEKIFADAKADLHRKIACTCGSGVTACVLALALYELGHKETAVYDGSWTEWSSIAKLPKATGAA